MDKIEFSIKLCICESRYCAELSSGSKQRIILGPASSSGYDAFVLILNRISLELTSEAHRIAYPEIPTTTAAWSDKTSIESAFSTDDETTA